MLKYVVHSLLISSLVFGFAACDKDSAKSRNKAARNGKTTFSDKGKTADPSKAKADEDFIANSGLSHLSEATGQVSAVYRNLLLKVIREQDLTQNPKTPLRIIQDVLKKAVVEKTKRKFIGKNMIGLEVAENKNVFRYVIILPLVAKEPFDIRLVKGFEEEQINGGIKLSTIYVVNETDFIIHINNDQFVDLIQGSEQLSLMPVSKCTARIDIKDKNKLVGLNCKDLAFIKNDSEIVLIDKLEMSQGKELTITSTGAKLVNGTKETTLELEIDSKLKVINYNEKAIYEARDVSNKKEIEPGLVVEKAEDDKGGDKDEGKDKDKDSTAEEVERQKIEKQISELSADNKLVADDNTDGTVTVDEMKEYLDSVRIYNEQMQDTTEEVLQKRLAELEQELKDAQNEKAQAVAKSEIELIKKELESRKKK